MGALPRNGRRTPLWLAAITATVAALVGAIVLTQEAEGQVAMDFLSAVERGDLEEAGRLAYVTPVGHDALRDAILPTHPWIPDRIVSYSAGDSAVAGYVAIATHSADPAVTGTTDLHFDIGAGTGSEYVIDPLINAEIVPGAELDSLTIAGRDVDPADLTVPLLPGIYELAGVSADGVRLTGRLTVTNLSMEPPRAGLEAAG